MISQIAITRKADDKAGMTVAEMNQFVQQCFEAGIDPRASIRVTIGWKQNIQTVSASSIQASSSSQEPQA